MAPDFADVSRRVRALYADRKGSGDASAPAPPALTFVEAPIDVKRLVRSQVRHAAGQAGVVGQAAFDGREPGGRGADGVADGGEGEAALERGAREARGRWAGRSGGLVSAWKTSRATKRFRQRMISLRVLPSVVRRAT